MTIGVVTSGIRTDRSDFLPQKFRIIGSVFLSIAYGVALHTTMRRYITGNDVTDWNLDNNLEWWWTAGPSPMTVWFLGTGSFIFLITYLMRNIARTSTDDYVIPVAK